VLLDVSDQKRAELQREELAHLSRVALLAELSGSLAHELNQPLTSILSNAQAAQRFMAHEPPNLAEVSISLVNIVDSDRRAGEVIRRLRAMLRKESPEFIQLDLNEVVKDVLRIIHSELLTRNVGIRLKLHPDLPRSEGDRVQLQQVLLNLIVNGSDAMRSSRNRELSIATRAVAEGVELTVSDQGTGIPQEDLERIFSPFVTTKQDGMGLGLAVCRTIIDSHNGRLWATNNDPQGACVHVWLPSI
jgi:C4-dicarboxylate-specific signal transduction histidine kinase